MTQDKSSLSYLRYWFWIIGILISLGILLRMIYLDHPVYWVDEVATSMRVSGYTQADVTQQLATGLPLSPSDILHVQQLNPNGSWFDLFRVLSKSPEHAPLYFILMRGWAELFGTSVTAMRSLSVVFSLLAFPVLYSLCSHLFPSVARFPSANPSTPPPIKGDRTIDSAKTLYSSALLPWTATALLAISPFFIAYAQEARPYSLWVLMLLVLHQMLWRSLYSNHRWVWMGYALALTLSLYTSLLTVLVLAGQTVAVMLLYPRRWRPYCIATVMALVAFLPWCWVIATHWQILHDNTSWMQEPMPLWALLGVWFYGLSVLFFDVPVAAGMPIVLAGQMLTSLLVMILMLYAVYALMTDHPKMSNAAPISPQSIGLFLFLGALGPPITLLTLDLIRNGQSAATPRYLMPMHLAVLIAVAYVVSDRLFWKPFASPPNPTPELRPKPGRSSLHFWPLWTAALLTISLLSCLIGVTQTSDYQKSRNLSNPAITQLINQELNPLVITEADNLQDVISLSYRLNPDVRVSIVPPHAEPAQWLLDGMIPNRPTFFFNPSDTMRQEVQKHRLGTLTPAYQPTKLIASELGLTLWMLVR